MKQETSKWNISTTLPLRQFSPSDQVLAFLPLVQSRINDSLFLFNDVPTHTYLLEHNIYVGEPICQYFYRVSEEKRKIIEKEIRLVYAWH